MDKNRAEHRYDDIINLPHPDSPRHPRMPLRDRAAQFSPFAALTGHAEAIRETARLTQEQAEQSEETVSSLNRKLRILADNPGAEAAVTYFVPDDRKSGGAYVTHTGRVKRIDEYGGNLIMEDRTAIPLGRIAGIESGMLDAAAEREDGGASRDPIE